MEKYLFNDGTNGVKEVQSKDELVTLIQALPDRSAVRIWKFNTNEWISYDEFLKTASTVSTILSEEKATSPANEKKSTPAVKTVSKKWGWPLRLLVAIAAAITIFLVYNFTRERWVKQPDYQFTASRPSNSPPINMDSLITQLEASRGQKLDKVTRTNLRIRNSWPELIQLQLTAAWEKSHGDNKFYNANVMIDNATGYNLDDIEVKFTEWKDHEVAGTDTLHFRNVGYATPAHHSIEGLFRGDSLSVSFSVIKSKVFNFCYSADKKSNYGNLADRWFCKE